MTTRRRHTADPVTSRRHLDSAVVELMATRTPTLRRLAEELPDCRWWDGLNRRPTALFRRSLADPRCGHPACRMWRRQAFAHLIDLMGHGDDFAVWLGGIGWLRDHPTLDGYVHRRPVLTRGQATSDPGERRPARTSNRAGHLTRPARALYLEQRSLEARPDSRPTEIARFWRRRIGAWEDGYVPTGREPEYLAYREWRLRPSSRREQAGAALDPLVAMVHDALGTVAAVRHDAWRPTSSPHRASR